MKVFYSLFLCLGTLALTMGATLRGAYDLDTEADHALERRLPSCWCGDEKWKRKDCAMKKKCYDKKEKDSWSCVQEKCSNEQAKLSECRSKCSSGPGVQQKDTKKDTKDDGPGAPGGPAKDVKAGSDAPDDEDDGDEDGDDEDEDDKKPEGPGDKGGKGGP